MKLRNMKYLILTVFLFLEFSACKSLKKGWDNLNLFPVSQDVELGKQVYGEIIANEKDFPKLPESGNEELYKYITGIISNKGQKLIAINGMSDHIHILIGMKPSCCLSDLVRETKKASNIFINEKKSKVVFLTNNGEFNFDFVWKRQASKYLTITPE